MGPINPCAAFADLDLPFPEGVASAEVIIATEKGGKAASYVFGALGIGAFLLSQKNRWGPDSGNQEGYLCFTRHGSGRLGELFPMCICIGMKIECSKGNGPVQCPRRK